MLTERSGRLRNYIASQWADARIRWTGRDVRRDYGRVSDSIPLPKLVRTECNVRTLRLEGWVLPSCREDVEWCGHCCRDALVKDVLYEGDEVELPDCDPRLPRKQLRSMSWLWMPHLDTRTTSSCNPTTTISHRSVSALYGLFKT
jgi:hypothetical protein